MRVVPKENNIVEIAEYTLTTKKPQGIPVVEAINEADKALLQVLDQKPPSNSPQIHPNSRFNGLPWKQSGKRAELSTIPVSENPQGLEKELLDLIKAGNGRYREVGASYKISRADNGKDYFQRWWD